MGPNPFTPKRFSRQRVSRDFEQSASRSKITSFYPSPSVHTLYIGHFLLFEVFFIVFGDFLQFLDEEISVKIVFELHFFFEILFPRSDSREFGFISTGLRLKAELVLDIFFHSLS